jgi:hypothetical protein
MERETHIKQIIELIEEGKELTRISWFNRSGSPCLNSRMADIKKMGVTFKVDFEPNKNNSGYHAVYYGRNSERYKMKLIKNTA